MSDEQILAGGDPFEIAVMATEDEHGAVVGGGDLDGEREPVAGGQGDPVDLGQWCIGHGAMIAHALSSRPMTGRVLVRMPPSLHAELADRAKEQGVSTNQLIVALLAGGVGFTLDKARYGS